MFYSIPHGNTHKITLYNNFEKTFFGYNKKICNSKGEWNIECPIKELKNVVGTSKLPKLSIYRTIKRNLGIDIVIVNVSLKQKIFEWFRKNVVENSEYFSNIVSHKIKIGFSDMIFSNVISIVWVLNFMERISNSSISTIISSVSKK